MDSGFVVKEMRKRIRALETMLTFMQSAGFATEEECEALMVKIRSRFNKFVINGGKHGE